jgi:hypothetical protein
MNEYIRKMTVCTLFIVPLLKLNRKEIIEQGFENAFIQDKLKEEEGISYDNGVYLLFRPFKLEQFNEFVQKERKNNKYFMDEYDHPNGWTVLVYNYDKKWENDVKLLMKGKFSKTSAEYQAEIPELVSSNKVMKSNGGKREMSTQHHIFKKTETLRRYWKSELGLELDNDIETEYWQYYEEREVLTKEIMEHLDTNINI